MKRKKAKSGFTLAEVLIALTIIGIAAALTIPAVMTKMQERELKTAFKREYTNFNQAFNKVQQVNIMPNSDTDLIFEEFKKHYSYIKECNSNVQTEGCWHKVNEWKDLDGTLMGSAGHGVILNNGVFLWNNGGTFNQPECTDYPAWTATPFRFCVNIMVDVNGFKGPNILGRDIFEILYSSRKIMPGGIFSSDYCDPTQNFSYNGSGCAIKVLLDQDY